MRPLLLMLRVAGLALIAYFVFWPPGLLVVVIVAAALGYGPVLKRGSTRP